MLDILAAATYWTDRDVLRRRASAADEATFDDTVDEMIREGLLDVGGGPPSPADSALAAWRGWNPAAGFFHAVSRAMRPDPPSSNGRDKRWKLVSRPLPPTLKEFADGQRTELPAFATSHPLGEVLQERRTWREFGARKLTLAEVSTLLGMTFGVQRWLETGDGHLVALKTSPSGGARHSIEAYLLSFGVDGLEIGTYHYCPDNHVLNRLNVRTTRDLLRDFLPEQPGFHDPAAVVVMTSVFERMQWKYSHPHAYRVVLLDAGHLGQTFALLATAQGLAPFCTAAIDSPRIEQHLGIDGVSEAPVLVLGVGSRPDGKEWSYKHDRSENPRTSPPAWQRRNERS